MNSGQANIVEFQFKPGDRRAGRPPGATNKTTRLLKEAIILAAEACGEDGKGLDGLVGYLKFLGREHPQAFATLLGRLLPLQVREHATGTIRRIPDDASEEEAMAIYQETVRTIEGCFEGLLPSASER